MSEPERPLLADLTDRIGEVAGDLRQMLSLRLELAERWSSRPVCAVCNAWPGRFSGGHNGIYITAAAGALCGRIAQWLFLVKSAASAGYGYSAWAWRSALWRSVGLAWRHFRRSFAGMAETLEECREDPRLAPRVAWQGG